MKKFRIAPFSPGGDWAKKMLLTMKLTIIILFLSLMQVSATVYSQATKFTFTAENKQVVDVLREIEENSQFRFFYLREQVDVERKVTVKANDATVEQILDELFKENDVNYELMNDFLIVLKKGDDPLKNSGLSHSFAQQQPAVSGTVTDEAGEPLPGVTVIIKGTTQGTVTNADGEYSITSIPEDATLQFSFVGMKTEEMPVGDQTVIDVQLELDAIGIEEVVAVGYGTMKKSDITGSVATADIESFRETSNTSVLQSLQGTVPGLNIGTSTTQGSEPSISIRGFNSLSGSASPLIVLDDVIFRGRITDINPDDIESVTVLKDASSAAIYGSQAANGVIIITTKRATEMGKPVFTYSGSVGFQEPAKLWDPMNREQFLEKNKGVYWRDAYTEESGYLEPNPEWNDKDVLITNHQKEGYDDGTDTDWGESVIRTGILNDHNLSMQARRDGLASYLSLGYTDSKGYVENDDFQRISVRLNVDYDIFDWFKVGVQTFMTVSDYQGRNASLENVLLKSPLAKSHNEDGSLFLYPDGFLTTLYYQETAELNKYTTLYGNFYASVDVPYVKGLTYKLNYAPNYRQRRYYTYNPYSLSETGAAGKRHWNDFDYALDHRLNYKKSINDNHSVDVTLATGREKRTNDYTSATSGQFAMQGLDWNRLEDGSIERQQTSSGAWQETSLYYMGRLVYNYADRYILTGTARRDGFSGFGANNKYGFFPSAALAWRFSEEGFLKDKISWLDNGKLRVSYGENGNRTLNRYQTLARMTSGFSYTFGDNSAMSQTTATMANPDLKWETTTSLNIGLDYAVLNSRINGAIEYYLSTTTDMLYQVPLPNMGGISSSFTNLGEIKNRGVEITINSTNIQRNDFTWNSTVSYSRNRNEIVSLLGRDADGDGIEDDLIASGLFIGESRFAIYTYNGLGLYQLDDTDIPVNSAPGLYRYEDISGPDGVPDGVISSQYDRKIIGYSSPAYRWSFRNEFSYKNFTLMVFINSIQGGKDHYYGSIIGPHGHGQRIADNAVRDNFGVDFPEYYWTPQNPDAPFKELSQRDPVRDYKYYQRSFIRLQDVSLSYQLNSSLVNELGIQDLRIFASGKNLYTWTDWYGLDPETGQGFMSSHPLLRNITFGINLTF